MDGSVDLDDFCDFFDIKTDSEMVSLSGFVMAKIGHPAKIGDRIEYENLFISVTAMEYHRVSEVDAAEQKNDSTDSIIEIQTTHSISICVMRFLTQFFYA